MIRRRRVETTIEIREFLIVHKAGHLPTACCEECSPVRRELVTPEEAAAAAGVHLRIIYRWIEAGMVHYLERPDGVLLVCPNSLPRDNEAIASIMGFPFL